MKHLLFIVFSFTLLTASFSQTEEVLSQLPFEVISDSIDKYMYSDTSKSISAAQAYILKAKRENNKEEQFSGLQSKAIIYYNQRNFEEATLQFETMRSFAQEHTLPKLEARAYLIAGNIQMSIPDLKEAIRYFNVSLQISENEGDDIGAQMALGSLSYMYKINKDYRRSLEMQKKTIEVFKNKPSDAAYTDLVRAQGLGELHYSISNSYLRLKVLDSAKYHSQQILDTGKEEENCYLRKYNLSQYYIKLEEEKFSEARKHLSTAESYCDQYEGKLAPLRMAYRYGVLAAKEENFQEARKALLQGLSDYQVSPEEEGYMSDYYKVLAEAFKQTEDFEQASFYFEKYLNTEEEYSKMAEDVSNANREKERSQFKKDIAVIKAEKEKKQSHLNYLMLGGSIIILALLFLLLKFYNTKKINEATFKSLLVKIEAAKVPKNIIDTKDEVLEEKNTNDIPEETKQSILDGLTKLEDKEYFLSQECNSYNMAKKLGTNTSYLSKVINTHYGKNFSTYINDLRINYAILRLKDDVIFRAYSIQAIAEEIGYKSADSFSKYFKKDTGLNPSFYIKNIKNIA